MITRPVDPEIIRGLIKARDQLDFWLMEQGGLTATEAPKLWQAAQSLGEAIEDVKQQTGFVEEWTTISPPRS